MADKPKKTHKSTEENGEEDPLKPLNIKPLPKSPVAVALESAALEAELPRITAAGRGKIAEQILQLAFENGIAVREDSDLAELLLKIELDSPIPSEAFMAVAEILSYVYRANGEPNPFDAVLDNAMNKEGLESDKAESGREDDEKAEDDSAP